MRVLGPSSSGHGDVVAILTSAEVDILRKVEAEAAEAFYVNDLNQDIVDKLYVGWKAIETYKDRDNDDEVVEVEYRVTRVILPDDPELKITLKGNKAVMFELARRGDVVRDGPWFRRELLSWQKDKKTGEYKQCWHAYDNHHQEPAKDSYSASEAGNRCMESERKTFKRLDKVFKELGIC